MPYWDIDLSVVGIIPVTTDIKWKKMSARKNYEIIC